MRIARRARRKNIKIARKEKSGAKRGESTDVKGKKLVEKVGDRGGYRVGEKLSLNQRKIIELKKKKASISARELSVLVGISQRKIEANNAKLKSMGQQLMDVNYYFSVFIIIAHHSAA